MSTIVGIATAPGIGGIGIIRMSGEKTFEILDKIFKPKTSQKIEDIKGYTIKYGHIVENNEIIDEVLVSYFKAPRSYTTENMCEINSHGGNVVVKKILEICLKNGAELAEPGEFTKRAFLNGRIDLAQAESVIDVINAKSDKEAKSGIKQLEGYLSKEIKGIKQEILDVLVNIEVTIDYPEYDTPEVQEKEIAQMLESVGKKLKKLEKSFDNGKIIKDGIKTAIIGKPNAGKSSLLNAILKEDRAIVTDIAGTTRDAVDAKVKWQGKEYIFIDTAGLRRKGKIKEEIERYSIIRAVTAVERADVCIIVIDATEGVTEQDTKVAGLAHEAGKACIIVVNKWDVVEKDTNTMQKMTDDIRRDLSYMTYAPIVFISALTGQRVTRLFELINYVREQSSMRITTGMLNSVLADAQTRVQPPTDKGRRLKIYYMTQVGIRPPHFVVFCNDKKLFHFSYRRYLENQIRSVFGLEGTPIIMSIRQKGEEDA